MPDRDAAVRAALFDESSDDLYEHAPCGYLSLLDDGTIGRTNATFLDLTGYTKEALVGRRRFSELLSVGGRIYYETHFGPLLRIQGFLREIAFEIVRADGERVPVLVNASQRQYENAGTITRITVFDASDRRRYERELLASRTRAEDASRAKADLIAMISHDVRGPLSAIMTAAALLEKSAPRPDQEKYIRVLHSSARQALDLVNNVLDLSRLDAGAAPLREREFSIRHLVEEIAGAGRAAASSKSAIEVRTRVDDEVPDRLIGDRPKLAQVLANLVMNAVKFTERGLVTIVVALQRQTDTEAVLDVSVSDTGIGIPADRLPHIFDEYTQAAEEIAEKYGGTGLGLAISRKLLRLYRAELAVTSTVGQGTTFSFVITLRRPGS